MKYFLRHSLILLIISILLLTTASLSLVFTLNNQGESEESIITEPENKRVVANSFEVTLNESIAFSADSAFVIVNELPEFVSINAGLITMSPTKPEHLGTFDFSLSTSKTEYAITVTTTLPPIDIAALYSQINTVMGRNANSVAYSILDTERDITLEHNAEELFLPASITKLPYALLVLHDIDQGKYSLNDTIPVSARNKAYESDEMYFIANGTELTIQEYLEYLIQESDNTAMTHLEDFLGGYETFKTRVKNELGIDTFWRFPNEGTTATGLEILKIIYGSEYLTQKSRGFLIDTMINTNEKYHNRIKAGVAEPSKVAHKIGNLVSDFGLAISDAAIVFGASTDLLIVIMTKDMINETIAAEIIAEITELVYTFTNT